MSLPPKPFGVLRYLVEHPGRLITHDELLDALWPETFVQPQVLRTYVLELRKVLGDDAGRPRFIQTLPKRGYCFVATVAESADKEPGSNARLKANSEAECRPEAGDAGRVAIVGREVEVGLLAARVELLVKGQRQMVFLCGEAGIGKTALVDTFYRQMSSALPIRVATGQCVEGLGGSEEYYPIMEALGQLCAALHGEAARRILARKAPEWLAALGREPEDTVLGKPARVAEKPEERKAGDLCGAVEELSGEMPLLLIFEDLQWADDATLHLISALARRQAPAQLMVLGTYRNQPAAAEQQLMGLKHDLLLRRLCVEVTLGPLTKDAVRELLCAKLGQGVLPPGLAAFVHEHSEGNPLFVIAMVEHLIAERFLVQDETAGWKQRAPFQAMEAGVPEGLAQMIELEIGSLSTAEQRMLEAGSLSDVVFPAWAVAAALEEDATEIEEACDELARRLYFLKRCGEDELPDGTRSAFYVFAHGLYREVLYQRQSASRRAKRHLLIAKRLGQLFLGREASVAREIAAQYEAAGSWRNAVDALRAAAWHAQQRGAYSEAAELLERTLRVADNLDQAERAAVAADVLGELAAVRPARA